MMEIFDVFFNLMLKTLIYRLKGTENLLLILVVTVRTEKLKCLKRGMDFSQQQNSPFLLIIRYHVTKKVKKFELLL